MSQFQSLEYQLLNWDCFKCVLQVFLGNLLDTSFPQRGSREQADSALARLFLCAWGNSGSSTEHYQEFIRKLGPILRPLTVATLWAVESSPSLNCMKGPWQGSLSLTHSLTRSMVEAIDLLRPKRDFPGCFLFVWCNGLSIALLPFYAASAPLMPRTSDILI